MKVLHIDFEKTWRGGEAQILYLIKGLREKGVQNEVCAFPDSELFNRSSEEGFRAIPLKSINEGDILSAYSLSRVIRRGGYDIVHFHTAHAHSIGLLALKMVKTRPRVILSRRVDFLVGQNILSRWKYSQKLDRIIAISGGVKNALINSGVSEETIEVVYSGVNLEKIQNTPVTTDLRNEFNIKHGQSILGNVAALAPHKDHKTLIRAIEILSNRRNDFKLIIFGSGSLEEELKNLVSEKELDSFILFAGFRENIISYMKEFDIFVLSSNLEGLCTSLIDASACGLPIVATETGGIPEIVLHNKTGLLSEPENPEQLADVIDLILSDPGLREEFSGNAVKHAENFDFKHTVNGTLQIYREVIDN